ncbi:SDR family oxidoreductase [Sinorhizobium mexicanum]|uniref:SDR family oxidoreductase n=1 Tax=Sinorhizobium mexicanum TaxID=375549 RepID=A0A859QKI3_9HYPH|nr:SDR family oxidoreductase [Sinorhizobium mexicanum]MBP1883768.1 NAD(P)-dependent dehydrogenase (short-subunit alcohol dehydrogenase family) [Sinorhizobium mexicanum]QLL62940.1 SDR family oxidoreductase [Sinorhizobium mexicanum]
MSKVAIVTGAGSGVGRAVSLGLLGAGYSVALAGRRHAELEETARLATGGQSLVLPTDVTDAEAVESLFAETEKAFGRLDLLFNNAGRGAPAVPIDELAIETWLAVVDTNLTGAFLCARAAFALMRGQSPRGGRIINNGSISAHAPRPFATAYTATKHAITGLTKQLALDGRGFDIVCGQIDIGNADTPLTSRMREGVLQADLSRSTEPLMDTKHVADAVLYMDGLPLDSNVLFMTVMANKMPFVGRG